MTLLLSTLASATVIVRFVLPLYFSGSFAHRLRSEPVAVLRCVPLVETTKSLVNQQARSLTNLDSV